MCEWLRFSLASHCDNFGKDACDVAAAEALLLACFARLVLETVCVKNLDPNSTVSGSHNDKQRQAV